MSIDGFVEYGEASVCSSGFVDTDILVLVHSFHCDS